jgi:hypothetical protein
VAFSDTISQTRFNTRKVIDLAVRRCKLTVQQITPDVIETAMDELYLMLSAFANMNVPLWCIQKQLYPLAEGQETLELADGTVDVLNSTLRKLSEVTGTDIPLGPGARLTSFASSTIVSTVGLHWAGPSVAVEFYRSYDGVNMTAVAVETKSAEILSGSGWVWYDLVDAVAAPYFYFESVGFTLAPMDSFLLGNTPSEIPFARLNRDDYVNLPNKIFPSERPLQFWLDRRVRNPAMMLWPVPNAGAARQQVVVWAHRQIMDVGTMALEIEAPQRWYDAIVSGLSARLALAITDVDPQLVTPLSQAAQQALVIAQGEERDNSPMRIAPNISPYTA